MICYLFVQNDESFINIKQLEIKDKKKYNEDIKILIVTKEKIFEAKKESVRGKKLKIIDISEVNFVSEEFKEYIINELRKENDKEALNEKYQYILDGKEGVISVLGYLEIIKGKTKDFSKKLFRGHSSTTWNLEPSLYRRDDYKIGRERDLYREVKKLNFNDFKKQEKFIDVLCRMQHYGIPTTLLDWTKNPLIALFFSCIPPRGRNGEVIYVEPKHYYLYESDEFEIFNKLLANQYSTTEKLEDPKVIDKINEMYRNSSKSNLHFVETIFENDRITAQNGLFSFVLNFDLSNTDNTKIRSEFRKYILKNYDSELKNKIWDKLNSKNIITEDDLFKFILDLKENENYFNEFFNLDRKLIKIPQNKFIKNLKNITSPKVTLEDNITEEIFERLYECLEDYLNKFQEIFSKRN